jgi:hypothetical protein
MSEIISHLKSNTTLAQLAFNKAMTFSLSDDHSQSPLHVLHAQFIYI